MKKVFLCGALTCLLMSSCVTLGKYEALESENGRIRKEKTLANKELESLKEEYAELIRQNQALNADMQVVLNEKKQFETSIDSLNRELEAQRHHYDTTMENYLQEITGKNRDLNKVNAQLIARTKELNEKEAIFKRKEAEFDNRYKKFSARQTELEAAEKAAKDALAAKERELETVRASVTNALVGFADKGLNVETKDGKVYVSMESKLMFASASWQVSKEGVEAIKELAKVLEQNPELNIMVEGHTDNDAYKGHSDVKDNWDLSVMRATAIVKLLLKHGPTIDPARVEACGHGEYAPKVENDSPENKAQNRRTEIILTPKLDAVLNILQ